MNNLFLIIPIYQPSAAVLPFLKNISPLDFRKVVVVDDGSGDAYQPLFESIRSLTNFEVISYPTNGGKGHALKTAFDYLEKMHPEAEGVVTADGDGQHALKDILQVRDDLVAHPTSLVLGVRDFHGKDVPKHNKMGNRFSAIYFHLATGVKLGDTQTGLRGIPKALFPLAKESKGERYEYEMNVLLEAVKEAPLIQQPIQTIYDGNKSSHFHPLKDSFRIYKTPLIYILVSLLSWVIDLGLFSLFVAVGPNETLYKILVGTIGARLISGSFNFTMNYFFVFDSKGDLPGKLLRYALVFFVNMGLSFGLTYAFNALPANLTFIKFVVDFVLFSVNYFVSRSWIFAKKKIAAKKEKKEAALPKGVHL
jgi:glycosyltransferase involved in cell wall biosynthesis